jgi:predicted nucleotidyltransferase
MLSPDFKEFIELLNAHNVQYLIVGGYALAFHGHPRYTKDIDIWIATNPENAQKMLNVLKDFGFSSLALSQQDFLEQENIIQLGFPPNRIDILTSVDGIQFADSISESSIIEVDGVAIHLIGIHKLIENKTASGRLQDLADVEKLQALLNEQNKDSD